MLSNERIIRKLAEKKGAVPLAELVKDLGISSANMLTHFLNSYMKKEVYLFKGYRDYVMLSPKGWDTFRTYEKDVDKDNGL